MDLKQTFAKEGRLLRFKAGRYAHAKQFKRMGRAIKRQRTIVARIARQMGLGADAVTQAVRESLQGPLSKARQIVAQAASRKNAGTSPKLYAWHAPEVECIAKGKSKTPYEFGVKVGIASTLKHNLIVGARSFAGKPYDGHTLRQAIEPIIGHLKSDHRMDRCYLKGEEGDRINAVLCAAGYNIRWLLRMIAKKGVPFLRHLYLRLCGASAQQPQWTLLLRELLHVVSTPAGKPLAVG